MILTIGVKTSDDFRGKLHNGFWLVKIFGLMSSIIFCFQIPFHNSLSICKLLSIISGLSYFITLRIETFV